MATGFAGCDDLPDDSIRRLVTLTPLSPLSGKESLQYTPALDNLAHGLRQFGFEMAYGGSSHLLQVSPVPVSTRPPHAPAKMSIDTFMGGLTRERTTFGYKPRMASSLVFSKAVGSTTKKLGSGTASPRQQATPIRCSTPQLPSSSGPRFSRLAQSVDSLQQLQVQGGNQVNPVNLLALASPKRPGTAPCRPSALVTPPMAVGASQTYSLTSGPGSSLEQPRLTSAPAGSQDQTVPDPNVSSGYKSVIRPSTASVASPPAQRPTTPCVDLAKAATAALRPSTAASDSNPVRPKTSVVRGGRPHPMSNFKATRGHALVVFQHMDRDKNGKLTLPELEDAALGVGFTLDQAHKLFRILDQAGKGYLVASDWGSLEMKAVIELFSLAYMQRFMGVPGPTSLPMHVDQYWATQDLKAARSVGAAIHMARSNALVRAARSATSSGDIIFDVFNFIDTDGSGRLSYDELRDGFYALGVYVKDDVLEKIIQACDADHDGNINYYEFIRSFFPKQWK